MANKRNNKFSKMDLLIFIVMFILLPLFGIYLLFQPDRWKKILGAICLVVGIWIWGSTIYNSFYIPKMEKQHELENIAEHTYTMGCGIKVRLPSEWDTDDYTVENADDTVLVVYDNESLGQGYNGRLLYVKCCTKDEADSLRDDSEADFHFRYFDKGNNVYRYVYSVTSYYNTEKYTYTEREEQFHMLENDLVWGLSVIPGELVEVEYTRE